MAAAEPEQLVVVGVDPMVGPANGAQARYFDPGSRGTLAAYGVDVPVALPGPAGAAGSRTRLPLSLPLSLAIGAWLLARTGWSGSARGVSVVAGAGSAECAALGGELAVTADRVALLVLGDGTACRSHQGPRPYDERAAGFDAAVVEALAAPDPARLLALDASLAAELSVQGRAAWQVLAGAADDAALDAEVLYDQAPYGVEYVVAIWERHG